MSRVNKTKEQKKNKGSPSGPFALLPDKKVIATDWSLTAGRWPFQNDMHLDNKAYNIVETATQAALFTTSNTVPTSFGTYWSVSMLTDIASLTTIFDQYRIVQLEVWVVPTAVSSTALYKTVIDYDNDTPPAASAAAFDAYSNCHTTNLNCGQYRKFTPHVAVAAYSGAFTSYENVRAPWIDCNSTGVRHYGLKLYSDVTPAATGIDVITRLHVQFRNKF